MSFVFFKESTFVYDLYYSDIPSRETCSPDFSDVLLDNLLSVHEVNMEDFVNEANVDEDEPFLGNLDDDEDSNEESNWRNDYPDSDNRYLFIYLFFDCLY